MVDTKKLILILFRILILIILILAITNKIAIKKIEVTLKDEGLLKPDQQDLRVREISINDIVGVNQLIYL